MKPLCSSNVACRTAKLVGLSLMLLFLLGDSAWAATPAATVFQWRPFLAPFHSVVLHFPIGFLTLGFVLEVYYWWRPSPEVRRVVTLVLLLSVLSGAIAAGLGLMRAGSGDYDEKTIAMHRISGLSVVGLAGVALVLQYFAGRKTFSKRINVAYRVSLVVAVGLMAYAGHQGGNLTHGSKYLVKNAPDFVKSLMEDEVDDASVATSYADEKDRFFAEKIQPIFANKCGECHSPEKQKGGYRLDQKEIALKGGKSGETAIKPGDPLHSNLVRLITLPSKDDDVMPPAGKSTLTPQEIVDIIHWIGDGAHFPEKASETSSADKPDAPKAGATNDSTAVTSPESAVAKAVPPGH